ncbi:hypothetical protein ACLESD_12045 [Pyxidicoccus sp. 3LFB2]
MNKSMAVWLVLWGVGCAHAPKSAGDAETKPTADTGALSARAEASYAALDFAACAEQFRESAGPCADDDCRATAFYRAAGCAALGGDASQAMGLLTRAADSGYLDLDHLRFNPELASLHAHADWSAVVARVEANRQKQPDLQPQGMPIATLGGIDVYGSRRVDAEAVRRLLGYELGKPAVPSKALFRLTERALREKYNLALAKVAYVYFFAGEDQGRAYVTVDLVDAEDSHRLRFLSTPSGHPEDPEGLVTRWRAYEDRAIQLARSGALNPSEPRCRVTHCAIGFGHPELEPLETYFVEKVPAAVEALTRVLREESDAESRAAAAFLLAYAATPEQTVERLVPFIRDPDGSVRNNVLRVLLATQEKAEAPLMDVAVVVDALSLPETADRNKSLFLLQMLLKDLKPDALKAQQASLIRQFGPWLVELTSLHQPINREPAVELLTLLAGKELQTPEQWKAWLAQQPK